MQPDGEAMAVEHRLAVVEVTTVEVEKVDVTVNVSV